MYKCKECNQEYKTKPAYCECGNDSFDYIEEISQKKTPLTLEQKSEIISRIFFAICFILALLVWLTPINKKADKTPKVQKTTVIKNIPDIDSIWKDTPIQEIKPVKPIATESNEVLPPKIEQKPQKPVQKVQKIQPVKKEITEKKTSINKPVQKPQDKVKIPDKTLQAAMNNSKPKTPTTNNQPKNLQTTKNNTPKPAYNPNSPAMIDYKTKLRAKLFSKFAVGSIQGSGSCSIQFSVNSDGKLVNRKFARESNNKSLNDTVYYMLMSVPYFSAPPTGYNGEIIRLDISIHNGNYEISIY